MVSAFTPPPPSIMYDLEEIPVKPPRAGGKIGFGDMGNDWEIKNVLVGPAQGHPWTGESKNPTLKSQNVCKASAPLIQHFQMVPPKEPEFSFLFNQAHPNKPFVGRTALSSQTYWRG